MTLTEFLLARFAEDEALARSVVATVGAARAGDPYDDGSGVAEISDFPSYPWGLNGSEVMFLDRFDPRRVLAECEAKRRIVVKVHHAGGSRTMDSDCYGCGESGGYGVLIDDCPTLGLMASVYADHQDYDRAWALSPAEPTA